MATKQSGEWVHVGIRLTRAEYARLMARADRCEPPAGPSTVARWLVTAWADGRVTVERSEAGELTVEREVR